MLYLAKLFHVPYLKVGYNFKTLTASKKARLDFDWACRGGGGSQVYEKELQFFCVEFPLTIMFEDLLKESG
jgi:hypothetical protein